MLPLLTYTLWDLCSLFGWKKANYFAACSVRRTHHCHQSPAVRWPSACTARCLQSILKKYIPHLLQRDVPDTSTLQAGSSLGPWIGSLCTASVQNKCHKKPFFFFSSQHFLFPLALEVSWSYCKNYPSALFELHCDFDVTRRMLHEVTKARSFNTKISSICLMGQTQIWNHSVEANRLTPGICLSQCA